MWLPSTKDLAKIQRPMHEPEPLMVPQRLLMEAAAGLPAVQPWYP